MLKVGDIIIVREFRGQEIVDVECQVEYDFTVESFKEDLQDGYSFDEAIERMIYFSFDYCEMDSYPGQENWSYEVVGLK